MSLARTATNTSSRAKAVHSVIVNLCPGCGSKVELSDEYDITTCLQCGSRLRVADPPDLPAYFLKPKVDIRQGTAFIERSLRQRGLLGRAAIAEPEQWLIPYWLFSGQLLKVRNSIERVAAQPSDEQGFDSSATNSAERERLSTQITLLTTTETCLALGSETPYLPRLSLGQLQMRRHPLVGLDPQFHWQLAEPRGSQADAIASCRTTAENGGTLFEGGRNKNPTRLFVHRAAFLFVPVYRWRDDNNGEETIIVDAVTGEVTVARESANVTSASIPTVAYARDLTLTAHRCPRCSHDLSENSSVIYRCQNCGECTSVASGSEGKFVIRVISPSVRSSVSSDDKTLWFPFWTSENSADFAVPAFALRNMEVAVRIARQMANTLPKMSASCELEHIRDIYPASIRRSSCKPFLEAAKSRISTGRELSLGYSGVSDAGVSELGLSARASDEIDNLWALVLIPFRRHGYEYTDSVIQAITFSAHALERAD